MTEWLKHQPDPGMEPQTADTNEMNLLEMMKLKHVVLSETLDSFYMKFSISQFSGSIGIASESAKPTLSIIYPGTNKHPLVLSRVDRFKSALLIAKAEQTEYLLAASRDKIYLLNLVDNISSVVYNFKDGGDWQLCAIDERTVACVAEQSSSDGFTKVYILNRDSEKFSLSGMLQVKTSKRITDICFVKTSDGTPCLLLSFRLNSVVQCVEMVGGRVLWQVDTQKMGRSFVPFSICTDGSTVFVANAVRNVLYLLSIEDGSINITINLRPFGVHFPVCVRVQGEHLYIGHMEQMGDTYCISKFTKPVTF